MTRPALTAAQDAGPSDTEMLDWVERRGAGIDLNADEDGLWVVCAYRTRGKSLSLRAAIRAAMQSEFQRDAGTADGNASSRGLTGGGAENG